MKPILPILFAMTFLAGCASSSVQTMSRSTFQVSSTTAPVCGRSGAARISSQLAAIEVIRRGGDRFVLADANSTEHGDGLFSRPRQGVIVRMVDAGDPAFDDALSAREVLGSDWQEQANRGKPSTCL